MQDVTLGWATGCPPDRRHKPTKPIPVFAGPSQDKSGQSSWVWQLLTTDHDCFASDHIRGWVAKREPHGTFQCWIPAHAPACRARLCSKHQHPFLKALVMKEASKMLQPYTAKPWQIMNNFMPITHRAILQWEQSSQSTAIHITAQTSRKWAKKITSCVNGSNNRKNIFPMSVVCLTKAMLTATDVTFSKLWLFMLREQGPTNDEETAAPASRCRFGHAASAGAQHQPQSAVTLLWAITAHL